MSLATHSQLLHRDMQGPFAICFIFEASRNDGHHELTTLKENGNVTIIFIDIDINAIIR